MQKLRDRLRDGHAKLYPDNEKGLDTVRGAIREQYEQEQALKRTKAIEPSSPTKEREPEEPDIDR